MRYPKSETEQKHQQILLQAARLFRREGLNGISLSEIMKAAGLTHGPFYNHFRSKEELIAKTVECAMEASLASLSELCEREDPKSRFLKSYLSLQHVEDPSTGCPMAALASDLGREPVPVRDAFTAQVKRFIELLASGFPWRSKRAARSEAIRLLTSVVGAVVLARALSDTALVEELLKETESGLASK
jgi:TetR/AcrR family transcriptional repressor of nem operon